MADAVTQKPIGVGMEARNIERYPLVVGITYQLIKTASKSESEQSSASTIDVSTEGLGISLEASAKIPNGSIIKCKLPSASGSGFVMASARVAWHLVAQERLGVEFVEPSPIVVRSVRALIGMAKNEKSVLDSTGSAQSFLHWAGLGILVLGILWKFLSMSL